MRPESPSVPLQPLSRLRANLGTQDRREQELLHPAPPIQANQGDPGLHGSPPKAPPDIEQGMLPWASCTARPLLCE